ncbi:AAA family ATPase [Desertivirga arenae]|uniref:AAA family ATPase n=1 Tax=Desertivirga arenae TaxID=2810309 RepID=UPI001A970843|nr:AAA family ATPase [Pedobacter sp. SYSU D00823]
MPKYIITGGPGAGKTSLLNALEEKGFSVSEEASRQLIIEEVAKGSECLPWINLPAFAEKALERMQSLYHAAPKGQATFFDRGIPDIIAYLKAASIDPDAKYYQALFKCQYHPQVFILPPWEGIYVNDTERWQTFEEASQLYQSIKETYEELGFELIELPSASIKERAELVVSHIENFVSATR